MNIRRSASLIVLAVATSAFAADHSSQYMAGTFSATGVVDDGVYASSGNRNARAVSTGHNIHYVRTESGMYAISAPVAVGVSILASVLTEGQAPTVHRQWFMDQLHEGDPVLLAARCDKHNNCEFWLPDPDKKLGKEAHTEGYYRPFAAKTNTQALCGKGKLSPDVEAKVCGR